VSSSQPPKPEHSRDLHVSIFRLNNPSSATIARSQRRDHRSHSIQRHRVRLRLNIRFHTCNSFPKTEGSSAGRIQVPIYLLRRVLTLAMKLVRISSEFIFFPIPNRRWLTTVYVAGSIEIPMYSDTHFLLSKPTVNETLTLDDSFVPQPSAAVTRLPPNPNFRSTAYSRLQNPTTLLTLSIPSWITSIIGKAFQTPRLRGLLKATEPGSWIR
jgi:hypothetical protein